MTTRTHQARVWIALSAVYLIWGSTYLAIRIGVHEIPPLLMAGIRFLVPGILVYFWARSRSQEALTWRQWASAAAVGGLMLAGGNGLVTIAEKTVPSSIAALLITTVPLWMVSLDALFYRPHRLPWPVLLGLVLGMAGVVVLLRPTGDDLSTVPLVGGALLLLAAFSWANGSLLSRRVALPRFTPLAIGMEMITAGALMLAVGLARGEASGFSPAAVSWKAWSAVAYLSVFGSVVALMAYQWLLKHCSPSIVGTYAFVNPIVAVALGWGLAGETLGPHVALAGALILVAVVLLHRFGAEKAAPQKKRPTLGEPASVTSS